MSQNSLNRQRVAIVTGGGGGIGAAIAEELGRQATFVITMDPLVTVDGVEQLPSSDDTTAGRINAAGGSARASSVSVTDREGISSLFAEVVDEHGGLDVVVNVAGITRPTSFTTGSEDDWLSVLSVHLDGYLNVLGAALPIMSAAGQGHILGVTSGSGWRPADTGAYGCAKRAVAALTWQLGRQAPPGVVVNALSPIAMTRMVTEALKRSRPKDAPSSKASSTGGLSLGSMPSAESIGPIGAHLVGERFSACRGQVVFSAGSEIAIIDQPRLLEALSTDGRTPLDRLLEAVTAGAFVPAETHQLSNGGSNARFATNSEESAGNELPEAVVRSCVVFADRGEVATAVADALEPRGVSCAHFEIGAGSSSFEGAASALASAASADGQIEAVVVALSRDAARSGGDLGWGQILVEHVGLVDNICADAAWARAVADYSSQTQAPIRLVILTDAVTTGGRSRAQASAQHSRSARGATDGRVDAFAVSVETADESAARSVGELVAHLLCSPDSAALSGAELSVGDGIVGLRSHPRVGASVLFDGPDVPDWLDATLRDIDPQGSIGSSNPANSKEQ